MDWEQFFHTLGVWISKTSTVSLVEHMDSERFADEAVFCEYVVNSVENVDLTEFSELEPEPIYRVRGQLRIAMTLAFVSHSQDPTEFALYYSELFRVRSKLDSMRQILREANHSVETYGPTTYLQELRDEHIFSRAEMVVTMLGWVDYSSESTESLQPVEHIELTTELEAASDSLQLDEETMP